VKVKTILTYEQETQQPGSSLILYEGLMIDKLKDEEVPLGVWPEAVI
jgi:hypothetical protein